VHLALPEQLQALEADVRTFLAGRLPLPAEGSARLAFLEALCERGWSVPLWPRHWGGGELTVGEAFVIDRTLTAAGAPVLDRQTIDLVGPLLMRTADELTCRRWLPDMARGAVQACCHGSLTGAGPLAGSFEQKASRTFRAQPRTVGVFNAAAAQVLAGIGTDGRSAALVLARLLPGAVAPGLPVDADTVQLDGLVFDVLAGAPSASALLDRGPDASRVELTAGRSCTGRLRHLLGMLKAMEPAADMEALQVSLVGLEAMELRVLTAGHESERLALGRTVEIRAGELGRSMVERVIEQLGYYALAAPDRARQHNELPADALAAQGAVAELIRYLLAEHSIHRDQLARFLERGSVRQN